jgi:hypothetical protein
MYQLVNEHGTFTHNYFINEPDEFRGRLAALGNVTLTRVVNDQLNRTRSTVHTYKKSLLFLEERGCECGASHAQLVVKSPSMKQLAKALFALMEEYGALATSGPSCHFD